MCKPFFCFPIRATLTIVVVEDIELDPFNNPARKGLRLPTYCPPTKEIAHPCYRPCFADYSTSNSYQLCLELV